MRFEWKESNSQKYLYVEGDNHYDLGVATGRGLKTQTEFYFKYFEKMASNWKMKLFLRKIRKETKKYLQFVPENYMQEIQGYTDGFNDVSEKEYSFDEIFSNSVMLNALWGRIVPKAPKSFKIGEECTNLGAVNPDGTVVHGQNYDTPAYMLPGMAWVHHKLADEPEAFILRLGLAPGALIGKNSNGVTMSVTVISSFEQAPLMTPRFVLVRDAFSKAKTAQEAKDILFREKGQFPFSVTMMLSDEKSLIPLQVTPYEHRKKEFDTTVAQSNQFDFDDWKVKLRDKKMSKVRQWYADDRMQKKYSVNNTMNNDDLLSVMQDRPVLCRMPSLEGSSTVAFITRESFGLNMPTEGKIGVLPI